MILNRPVLLSSTADRARLAESMRILTNMDIMVADESVGVLFAEDYTDLNILGSGHEFCGTRSTSPC